jgi:type I restriction enzyme S subunit
MRKGWEYKKLGEVCTIKAGYTPKKNELSDNGAYPYYKVADMNTLGNDVYLDITSSYKIDANKLFPKGAIVFPKNGAAVSTNKKRILKYDSIVDLNTGVAIFPKSINEKFAYYWFIDTDFKKYVRGGALPTLDIKSLKDKPFPSIDKSTQLAIVTELDKINELIRLKKEQLKDFDNLAQSLFYEMFGDPVENEKGWEVKKIGDLALVKTGPFGSMLHKEDYICDGIPLVNPVHMKDFKIVPDLDFTISKEKASELENYLLKSNDVVFARRGDIGRCAIVSEAEQGFICGTGSLFVRFSKEIESIFIMYIIRCDSFSKHLISKAKGATMLNINSNTIADLRIPLPPLSLQRLFAQRIEQIEREKSEVQKSIQDLETLLASRMQYWFE